MIYAALILGALTVVFLAYMCGYIQGYGTAMRDARKQVATFEPRSKGG